MSDACINGLNPRRLGMAMLAGILPLAVVAAHLATGISLSPDSLTYLYAARHLLEHGDLIDLQGGPLTIFPPIYPALLACGQWLVGSATRSATLASLLCMASASVTTYALLRRMGQSPGLSLALTLAVFLHPSMQMVFWHAWSEGLYIVISLVMLLVAANVSDRKVLATGAALGVLAGLGFLTRYAGISLVPVAVTGLMCATTVPLHRRLKAAGIASLIGLAIIGTWMWRNHLADGTWLGPRSTSEDTILFALRYVLATIGQWLAPYQAKIGLIWLLLLLLLMMAAFRRSYSLAAAILPALTQLLIHIALMVYSQLTTVIDPIDARLLSPAVVPAVLVVAGIFRHGKPVWANNALRTTALAFLAISIVVSAALSVRSIGQDSSGYRLDSISERDIPEPCRKNQWPIFTNNPAFLRFTGVAPAASNLPRQILYRTTRARDDWQQFQDALGSGNGCILWMGSEQDGPPSIEQLLGGPAENLTIESLSQNNGIYGYKLSHSAGQ